MTRRKRDDDLGLVGLITALVSLAVLAYLFMPGFQQLVSTLGWILLIALGLGIAGLIIFGIFRLATPERHMTAMTRNVFSPPLNAPDQKSDADKPDLAREETDPIRKTLEKVRQMARSVAAKAGLI